MSSKADEASQHIRSAEKFLKTSWTKWKSDNDSAAEEFTKAAQCFRIARMPEKAMEAHKRASRCHKQNNSLYHAAKSLENAILANKDLCSNKEIYDMAMEAADLYQQHGSGDTAASLLDKSGSILSDRAPAQAFTLFKKAAEVSAGHSNTHNAPEYLNKAAKLLIRQQRFDEAVDCIRGQMGFYSEFNDLTPLGRLCVGLVLLQLARGDLVAAEKVYREWGCYCESTEANTLESLLGAFDDEDGETAKNALNSPFIRNMDIEYAQLARIIKLPQGMSVAPRAVIRENVSPNSSASSSSAPYVESKRYTDTIPEEEGGGLC